MINITLPCQQQISVVEKSLLLNKKIRELKNRISNISDQNKAKMSLTIIINHSAENMSNVKSEKYKLTPNKIEKKYLENQDLEQNSNLNESRYQKTSDILGR